MLHRIVATAAAVSAALIVVPGALAQSTDTTSPVLTTTTSPTAPAQRNGNPPAVPSTSTGNGNWYKAGPVTLNVSATDNVGVTKFEYSIDNGATWNPMPADGNLVATNEGSTPFRVRAFDANGNVTRGNQTNTTLNQAAAAGADRVRLQSTNGRSVGDDVVFEPGTPNEEVARIAELLTASSPNPNVRLTAPLSKDHAASSAVQA